MPKEPYQWQREAAKLVQNKNLILNVGTGCGKTLVAVLAIDDARRLHPQKKCAFVVNTRILAHQQCVLLQAESCEVDPHRVQEVTGYTVGKWGEDEWRECLERCDVLVGTAEVFRKAIIDQGFFNFGDFSLMVFDECHNACGGSNMAQILRRLHANGPSQSTRVLGLTASFANTVSELGRAGLEHVREGLEATLCASVLSPDVAQQTSQRFVKVSYNPSPMSALEAAERVQELFEGSGIDATCVRKITRQLKNVLQELGREAFTFALRECVIKPMEARIDDLEHMPETMELVPKLKESAELSLPEVAQRSDKVERLLALIRDEGSNRGIIFVEEVALAVPLARLLNENVPDGVGVATGAGSMNEQNRNVAFGEFRRGDTQLLVCTPCAEEGVDVSSCHYVVRFSAFHTTRSHIQGSGRARAPRATIYYFENDPDEECARAAMMADVARVPSLDQNQGALDHFSTLSRFVLPGRHPYVVPSTKAEVSFDNARRIFSEYCAKVSHGQTKLSDLLKAQETDTLAPTLLAVPGPHGGCSVRAVEVDLFLGDEASRLATATVRLCYVAVLLLHSSGWLTEHNKPSHHAVRLTSWPPPVPVEEIPTIHLIANWCPPGLFGGGAPQLLPEDRVACGPAEGAHRPDRVVSGSQQRMLRQLILDPADLVLTQGTVNRTFSNGSSVLRAMVGLARGRECFEDFPLIRVALGPPCASDPRWHSADNRRGFMFQVVAPLLGRMSVRMQEISWTDEFDYKLQQEPRLGRTWRTDAESVQAVRSVVERVSRAEADGDDNLVERLIHDYGGQGPAAVDAPDESAMLAADEIMQNLFAARVGQASILTPGEEGEPQQQHGQDQERCRHKRLEAAATAKLLSASEGQGPADVGVPAESAMLAADEIMQHPLAARVGQPSILTPGEEGEPQQQRGQDRDAMDALRFDDSLAPDDALFVPAARIGSIASAMLNASSKVVKPDMSVPPPSVTKLGDAELVDGIVCAISNAVVGAAQHDSPCLGHERLQQHAESSSLQSHVSSNPRDRCEGEDDRIFRRIRDAIAKLSSEHAFVGPVSSLNLAAQGSFRPTSGTALPIEYEYSTVTNGDFICTVRVCGRSFAGVPCRGKKEAKHRAALAAVSAFRAGCESADGELHRLPTATSEEESAHGVARRPAGSEVPTAIGAEEAGDLEERPIAAMRDTAANERLALVESDLAGGKLVTMAAEAVKEWSQPDCSRIGAEEASGGVSVALTAEEKPTRTVASDPVGGCCQATAEETSSGVAVAAPVEDSDEGQNLPLCVQHGEMSSPDALSTSFAASEARVSVGGSNRREEIARPPPGRVQMQNFKGVLDALFPGMIANAFASWHAEDGFRAQVTLPDGSVFCGDAGATTKKAAEQIAASVAVRNLRERADTNHHLAQATTGVYFSATPLISTSAPAEPSQDAACEFKPRAAFLMQPGNFKGVLNERYPGQLTNAYETWKVQDGFRARVRLPDGSAFEGNAAATTKKDAEQIAACVAVRHLQEQVQRQLFSVQVGGHEEPQR